MENTRKDSAKEQKTLDRREAARYLGVCVMTVDRATRDGEIDHYRIGRRVLFDEEQLDRFLMKSENKSNQSRIELKEHTK